MSRPERCDGTLGIYPQSTKTLLARLRCESELRATILSTARRGLYAALLLESKLRMNRVPRHNRRMFLTTPCGFEMRWRLGSR